MVRLSRISDNRSYEAIAVATRRRNRRSKIEKQIITVQATDQIIYVDTGCEGTGKYPIGSAPANRTASCCSIKEVKPLGRGGRLDLLCRLCLGHTTQRPKRPRPLRQYVHGHLDLAHRSVLVIFSSFSMSGGKNVGPTVQCQQITARHRQGNSQRAPYRQSRSQDYHATHGLTLHRKVLLDFQLGRDLRLRRLRSMRAHPTVPPVLLGQIPTLRCLDSLFCLEPIQGGQQYL